MLSFFDMKRISGLQVFDGLLVLVMITLALATVVIPAGLLAGRGDTVIDATLARPYGVLLPGGRSIEVGEGGAVVRRNFHEGKEARYVKAPPTVSVKAQVERRDVDTRVALGFAIVLSLAVTWAALLSLRGVVRSARSGDPFVASNVRRLRVVAGSILALPVIATVGSWVVDGTLDSDVDLRVRSFGPSLGTCVVVAVGLLALAHVFREGIALRELEQGTV
jgi:hypothetical protein